MILEQLSLRDLLKQHQSSWKMEQLPHISWTLTLLINPLSQTLLSHSGIKTLAGVLGARLIYSSLLSGSLRLKWSARAHSLRVAMHHGIVPLTILFRLRGVDVGPLCISDCDEGRIVKALYGCFESKSSVN